mmetsp:Transcript_120256/g.335513  ORF Transcript_120256/g.335513 Transcript_120256/m.335513 type:complete len:230 (-) Transcript_120256:579-1268(-)
MLGAERQVLEEGSLDLDLHAAGLRSRHGRPELPRRVDHCQAPREPERPRSAEARPKRLRRVGPFGLDRLDHPLVVLEQLLRVTVVRVGQPCEEGVQQRLEVWRAWLKGLRVDSLQIQFGMELQPLCLAKESLFVAGDENKEVVLVLRVARLDSKLARTNELIDNGPLQELQETSGWHRLFPPPLFAALIVAQDCAGYEVCGPGHAIRPDELILRRGPNSVSKDAWTQLS